MKKILSSALIVLTLFASVACFIPVKVEAAYAVPTGTTATLEPDKIKEIITASYVDYGQTFTSAQDRLDYEEEQGYILSITSASKDYTIYVNKYTGMMYYKNNKSEQILTSNPAILSDLKSDTAKRKVMSQISLKYSLDTGAAVKNNGLLLSSLDSADRAQITVNFIADGIRVNYTIGDTTTRYNVPAQIMEEDLIESILEPMLENYERLIENYLVPDAADMGIELTEEDYVFDSKDVWGYQNSKGKWFYEDKYDEYGNLRFDALTAYLNYLESIVNKVYPALTNSGNIKRNDLRAANVALGTIATSFTLVEPANTAAYGEGGYAAKIKENVNFYTENPDSMQAIYVCSKTIADGHAAALENLQNNLANYAGYNASILLEHETKCLYEAEVIENPVFRCSLEYTFNSDGSLSVRLPVNSISFDEKTYNLDSISPLQYFGAGNLTGDGYVFIPDGSGSVIEYDDFYTAANVQNVALKLSVYGDDFAYANPTGKHKEPVTMPVYGITTQDTEADVLSTGSDAPMKGYFAILEEGASLASLSVEFGGNETKRATVYSSYSPYPSDQYARDSAVGGSVSTYTIVSDSKYTGSYVTRYVFLGDEADEQAAYKASYVGMATCYRDYLKARGELTAIENLGSDLPLYIEALGSMSIVEKVLTFPVTVSKALTTFDDIVTMYSELTDVTTRFSAKAAEYRAKGDASVDNKTLREKYYARAAEYDELVATMDSIKNINFKLTGFANGGMYYTYPSKVKWEKACGGKRGFNELIETAKAESKDGYNFGVYPEFDFSYVSNSAWSDGIDSNTDLSRMVDNRYASKQVYNSVLGIYESFYSMVVSTDALDGLYNKFDKSFSKYGHGAISVSTLGSDLNSNLDRDNAINRHDSSLNVSALLDRIANTDEYEVMTSVGNSYALAYADHVLDISTDSSHFIYSSYTVPFIGMVLHSYVSYAGSPLNYAGSPDYEILRAIENGASLYYILCFDNTEFMKEDHILNDYYGIDYQNWFDNLVRQYNIINDAIGEYQAYEIVDHKTIIAERVIDASESKANMDKVKAEFVEYFVAEIEKLVDAKFNDMAANSQYGYGIKLTIDYDAIVAQASAAFNIPAATLETDGFKQALVDAASEYVAVYSSTHAEAGQVTVGEVSAYESDYDFVTDSIATDGKNYDTTAYTADNDRVVIVTYRNPVDGKTVSFILNYNVYTVNVNLGNGQTYTIGKYGFQKI